MSKTIIHYQSAPGIALCFSQESINLTTELPHVTCGNCISAKRRESQNKHIDWDAIKTQIADIAPRVRSELEAFAQSNGFVGSCSVGDFPPRLTLWLYLPAQKGKRKTVGYNIGKGDESNVVQVYVPNETELDIVADFIGQLAETYGLRAYRKQGSDLLPLWYELKAKY